MIEENKISEVESFEDSLASGGRDEILMFTIIERKKEWRARNGEVLWPVP